MLKKASALILVVIMTLCIGGCGKKEYKLPEYSHKQFSIGGGISPYVTSEETLQQYKDAGLNTLYFGNHDFREMTGEAQYYLGSERTMKTLELCKKLGLYAVLSNHINLGAAIEGDDYICDTMFSKYDLYEDYKDIITGVNIWDEPRKDHIPLISSKTQIEDFKKVYPNADYMVNLIPITAGANNWGYTTYENMLDIYCEEIISKFEHPYISLDVYPFHLQAPDSDMYMAANYELIAKRAKQYGAKTNFYIQSSTGNEFEAELSEGDMRWEINSALAFGAESLIYYCYSVPIINNDDGSIDYMYDYCVLNRDNTPSKIYYYIQEIHKEIQSYASVILSYNWDMSKGIDGSENTLYRVGGLSFNEFENAKHYVSATATHDLIVSRFTSDQYGEAYMLVNFADRGGTNKVEAEFKDCGAVAIYGEIGFDGTPRIVELTDGKLSLELEYGEGAFVTPLI